MALRTQELERRAPLRQKTPLERRTPLKRATPLTAREAVREGSRDARRPTLKRSRGISPATPAQREAVRDLACIVCGSQPCDPAHLIDRSMAPAAGDDPRAVIPLCRVCHDRFDEGDLDLSPYLEPRWRENVAWAVNTVGLWRAVERITKRDWRPVSRLPQGDRG